MRYHREVPLAGLPPNPLVDALDRRLRGPQSVAVVSAEQAAELRAGLEVSVERLALALLEPAKRWSRVPVSGFEVGAVAVAASGAVYLGANIEFPGLPLSQTVHAEQAAICLAIGHRESALELLATSAAPCGFCRQFMLELPSPRPRLLLADRGEREPVELETLIPAAFAATSLGRSPELMRAREQPLAFIGEGGAPSRLARAALAAAARSSAPYTGALAGVALETGDGHQFVGKVAESAAYNPTLAPMQAALIQAHHGGARLDDIREAVLVELEGGKVSQLASARQVLASVAPTAVLRRRFAGRRGSSSA